MPDVAVIGFGYIGSVIAAVLAERGLAWSASTPTPR